MVNIMHILTANRREYYIYNNDILLFVHLLQRADELLEEVILSWTLNQLREQETKAQNLCPTFIRTQEYVFSVTKISWRCNFML